MIAGTIKDLIIRIIYLLTCQYYQTWNISFKKSLLWVGSESRHNGVLLSEWHPEESPHSVSTGDTALNTTHTHWSHHADLLPKATPLSNATYCTVWHIYSRQCICTHANKHAHTHAVQWQGCLWLHQPERLSFCDSGGWWRSLVCLFMRGFLSVCDIERESERKGVYDSAVTG